MSADRLAGVWKLQAFEFTDADGNLFHPLGTRPGGALVVTPDGHAVVSFCNPDRRKFASDDVFGGSVEELAAASKGHVSFGGPCEVTDTTITVHVDYASFPNWVGGTQVRLYEIDGPRLTLRTPGARVMGGVERSGRADLVRG